MNPALHQDLMQAQRHDLMRSAAQRRLLAEVKAARAVQIVADRLARHS